uniref:Chromo domain-containing protein n=1 Tax=Populus trichocarpa TaxID=3694 RepID=A0A2K1XW45_POPTR
MPGTRSGNSYNPNQGLREPDLTAYQGCMSSQELQDSPSTVPQVQPAPKTVDSILTHQFVSTRRGGYYKFLVKWASKPKSEADWLQGSEDQDSSKEQCVTAATDFAEARGLKYSVLAKIPTMHVNVNVPAKHVDKEAVN